MIHSHESKSIICTNPLVPEQKSNRHMHILYCKFINLLFWCFISYSLQENEINNRAQWRVSQDVWQILSTPAPPLILFFNTPLHISTIDFAYPAQTAWAVIGSYINACKLEANLWRFQRTGLDLPNWQKNHNNLCSVSNTISIFTVKIAN